MYPRVDDCATELRARKDWTEAKKSAESYRAHPPVTEPLSMPRENHQIMVKRKKGVGAGGRATAGCNGLYTYYTQAAAACR